jgi:hypothetical protein
LQILNRNAFQPPKHSDAIPLKRKKGVFLVPLSINNGSLTWVRLDTGCNSDLHWVTRDSALVSRQSDLTIAGVGNTTSQTADVTASIGGHTSIVEAVLQQKPIFSGERGLLGNGFLSQFIVTVDAKNAYLYLENHSYSASSGLAP